MFTHSINCPYCNSKITEDWSDYITSSDVIDENRQMGAEIEHSIECDEYKCPDCKKLLVSLVLFGSIQKAHITIMNSTLNLLKTMRMTINYLSRDIYIDISFFALKLRIYNHP